MSIIEMSNIVRTYKSGDTEFVALNGINIKIDEGEFVAIMGPSGSGKSTLMQIMGLLDRPTNGQYYLFGHDVSTLSDDEGAVMRSKVIGFVFQQFNLLKRANILQNVLLPMIYTKDGPNEKRGKEVIKVVGLTDYTSHNSNQLSGGQQQRVAIARALVNQPKIILADEPTGNLASDQAKDILKFLNELNKKGITIILITHEEEIASFAKRVIRLKDGKIIKDSLKQNNNSFQSNNNQLIDLKTPEFSFAELKEHISSAFRTILSNKVRSALSILGVLIGVASVVSMLSIGQGAKESIKARLQSLGSNVIMLFPGAPNMRGIMGTQGDYTRLTVEDAKIIRKSSPHIVDIYPEVEGQHMRVVYKDQNTVVEVQGVPISYESIRNSTPVSGKFFTEMEDISRVRVALLGQTVIHDLFKDKDPVGETIKINTINFKVIGVLPQKGMSAMSDQDALIIIPLHTAMKRLLSTDYLHEIAIQCDAPENIPKVIDDITNLLRKKHRLPSFKENDFTLRNNAETQRALSETTQTLSLFLLCMATISLIVGGIGIMNVMLVSVNERTKEIGLRKAIGAAQRAILIQFLIEASTLSITGGIIGIALGIVTNLIMASLGGWNAVVTIRSIILAFTFSAGVGVIFGFWPAYQASLRSPIEALRYE